MIHLTLEKLLKTLEQDNDLVKAGIYGMNILAMKWMEHGKDVGRE